MKQCAVLYIRGGRQAANYAAALRAYGLRVHESDDWPDDHAVLSESEAVLVHVGRTALDSVAMRLRAKRGFGRRVLIALVPCGLDGYDKQCARAAGFDEVIDETCDVRKLLAAVLRTLRQRQEFRCRIPSTRAA